VKRIEVEWVDSLGSTSWEPMQDKLRDMQPEALQHRSVGYVLRDDDTGIILAGSMSDRWHDNVCDVTYIPRQAVLKVHDL
jgi:hypothetical protein